MVVRSTPRCFLNSRAASRFSCDIPSLTKDFQGVEEERVGHGKHEEFHRMMDRRKAAYGI